MRVPLSLSLKSGKKALFHHQASPILVMYATIRRQRSDILAAITIKPDSRPFNMAKRDYLNIACKKQMSMVNIHIG